MMVGIQGYLLGPSASPAGNSYQDVPELRIADTRYGTGGIPATPIPAGGSVTFSATGADGVPATGVPAIAESVAALNPAATGYLSAYAAGTADPNEPGVNFNGSDYQDNDISTPVLSTVSPTGQETITNHSTGTVDVVVSVRGYYQAPAVPAAPSNVADTVTGSSATVTWSAPRSDGGSPVTGYTITAPPDTASVQVGPGTYQATLSGLSAAATDTFTVTAASSAGTSVGATALNLPGSQGANQSVDVVVDPTSGDVSLDTTSSASTDSVNPDGSMTSSAITADTSDAFNPSFDVGNCGRSRVASGVNVLVNGHWNNYFHGNSYSADWTHRQYEVKNAEKITPQGGGSSYWTYQVMVCATGGANTWNGWYMNFSGDAIQYKSTSNGPMIGWHWSKKVDSNSTVSSTLGFQLGAGYADINGSMSVGTTDTNVVANSEYQGDTNADSLFPGIDNSWDPNRVNTSGLRTTARAIRHSRKEIPVKHSTSGRCPRSAPSSI